MIGLIALAVTLVAQLVTLGALIHISISSGKLRKSMEETDRVLAEMAEAHTVRMAQIYRDTTVHVLRQQEDIAKTYHS